MSSTDNPERAKLADEILETSYAKHMIREETHRQMDAWLKWKVIPATAIAGAALAVFGWNLRELNVAFEQRLKEVSSKTQEVSSKTDEARKTVESALGTVEGANQRLSLATELMNRVDKSATAQSEATQSSFNLIADSRRSILETQDRLATANSKIESASQTADRVPAEKEALTRSLENTTGRLDALAKNQETLSKDIDAKRRELETISNRLAASISDVRRIRSFQIRFVTTGDDPQSVTFDDPDGRGDYKLTLYELRPAAGGGFAAVLSIQAGRFDRCVSRAKASIDDRMPYELKALTLGSGDNPSCLPPGLRLTLHSVPVSGQAGEKKPVLLVIDAGAS